MKKLEYNKIQDAFDRDYSFAEVTRERAAADLSFFWITHWDDAILSGSQLLYKGEFDLLRKAMRDILSDMRSAPVQANFESKDGTSDELADLMDGIYRTSCRDNVSNEAFDNASIEQVVCGLGGWRLRTKYESDSDGNNNQYIAREPIHEFNSTVFFDANAKYIDKSDALCCTVLVPMSSNGYIEYYEELTGEALPDPKKTLTDFAFPENGWSFPWALSGGSTDIVYIAEHYHRYKEKVKIHFFRDFLGNEQAYEQQHDDDEKELISEYERAGYEKIAEKKAQRWCVDKYILDGQQILSGPERIAGEYIPVVPQFGERAYIQGVEHWEGIVKAAKDPQLLRDFAMSYMADIVSRSPRIQPIYTAEQIQGFEFMYNTNGSDAPYPYLLQNAKDLEGNPLPVGPVGQTPEQPVPQGLAMLLDHMRMAVDDVASAGLPNSVSDVDLSGKALNTMVAQFDHQSLVYQDHRKYSHRYDALVFASMAKEIFDSPRKLTTTKPDGTRKYQDVMAPSLNLETGEVETKNDLTKARFDVFADVGRAYSTSKDEARAKLEELLPNAAQVDPMLARVTLLKIYQLQDGEMTKDLREYARNQLILAGVNEPESEEEAMMLQASKQQVQPDANMELAKAEQIKAQNGSIKNQIDQFRAETDRMAVMVDAEKAGADIDYKRVQAQSLKVNDAVKVGKALQPQQMRIQ